MPKTLKLQNEFGETIEVKYSLDGVIKIRHSDVDKHRYGEFHEYSKRVRQARTQAELSKIGIDANTAKAMAEQLGGYMALRGKAYHLSASESAMIVEAIAKAGYTIPNWSNRP